MSGGLMDPYMGEWQLVDDGGVECVEHDGYLIDLETLRSDPPFWVRHIAGKEWATPEVLGGLTAWALTKKAKRYKESA